MNSIEYVQPRGLLRSGTFSQVVVSPHSRLVFTAGQVAVVEHGNLVGGNDLAAQTQRAMFNLKLSLAAVGASFKDVVKTTTFVVNYRPECRDIITQAKEPFYEGGEPPASALIGVSALAKPEWLIEIEAIACLVHPGAMQMRRSR